jgi:hypothetical protein
VSLRDYQPRPESNPRNPLWQPEDPCEQQEASEGYDQMLADRRFDHAPACLDCRLQEWLSDE